ncbi:alpha/beta hydrolase [Roseomonas sp. GC11]|uniref:alpha/beta fold hydrolase n=1 Tax=Roseomonas sp. GC11 TaxID=2950546 RepID=UPI00210EC05D|nr:alpha/beta fold hydrolase [Roseomonas sp. GC11]MCQ4161375.1 alpha/beta hydrolase [Roseomonas sp. GC11]
MPSDYTRAWAGRAKTGFLRLADGRRIRHLEAGTGPALLLMHTLRTQLDYFQRLIPLLTRRFTVHAVDLPGLGWSDATPEAGQDEPAVRSAMLEVVEQLGLGSLTLAGESMGATLALTMAAGLGPRATHVVALNPYDYPGGVERANLVASLVIKVMRIPGIGLLPAKAENPAVLGAILRGGFADPGRLPADFVAELVRSGQRPGFARTATGYLRSLGSYVAARGLYGRVTAPVTLVYGAQDWSTLAERDEAARLLPHSRMVTLADTGHFAALERPEAIARLLLETRLEAAA